MEYIIGEKTLKYRIEQGTFPFSISKDFNRFFVPFSRNSDFISQIFQNTANH